MNYNRVKMVRNNNTCIVRVLLLQIQEVKIKPSY